MKIRQLEVLASQMVGDGKKPNLFFVSTEKNGIVFISRYFPSAYEMWKQVSIGNCQETTLEDRQNGVLCSVEPEEEGSKKLIRHDDSNMLSR